MKAKFLQKKANTLGDISALKPQLAAVGQEEYDGWDASGEFGDSIVGGGGIRQLIANRMSAILTDAGFEVREGGQDGDDHAFLLAFREGESEVYEVDIPPGVYETGGGYYWEKIPGVTFTPDDVYVGKAAVTVADLDEGSEW